jgi:hypothetical protein
VGGVWGRAWGAWEVHGESHNDEKRAGVVVGRKAGKATQLDADARKVVDRHSQPDLVRLGRHARAKAHHVARVGERHDDCLARPRGLFDTNDVVGGEFVQNRVVCSPYDPQTEWVHPAQLEHGILALKHARRPVERHHSGGHACG